MKTYSEKLRDPRWQKKRLEILNRDDWSCRFCGWNEDTLHVHHLAYISGREPWDYPDDHLLTLCEGCHAFESECRKQDEANLIYAMKLKLPSVGDIRSLLQIINLWEDPKSLISTLHGLVPQQEEITLFLHDVEERERLKAKEFIDKDLSGIK